MPIAVPVAQPDEPVIVVIDGLLWKPCPGAEATAAEFEAARFLFIEVHREARWNRWVEAERAADLEAAMAVMGQWTRAEPDFRQKTPQEVEEWLTSWKAEFEEEQAEQKATAAGPSGWIRRASSSRAPGAAGATVVPHGPNRRTDRAPKWDTLPRYG